MHTRTLARLFALAACGLVVASGSKLRAYLHAGLSRELSVHNRVSLLWAASVWDNLLSPSEEQRFGRRGSQPSAPRRRFPARRLLPGLVMFLSAAIIFRLR